ncbi:MAG: thiamine diphosphokinase [Lachnospiraceae bacterium]|nr:thiamine diphosphokinase [Lachnospiraceae bacterium]
MKNDYKDYKKIIIVAGGEIDDDLLYNFIKKIKEPYIIGVDKGIEALERIRYKSDIIIGDFDSASEYIREKYIRSGKAKIFSPEKDETDTHLAVIEALKLPFDKKIINIFGATGKRMDHFFGNIGVLKLCLDNNVESYIIDKYNKIRMINKDITLYKDELFGEFISLVPFSDKVEGVSLEGFKYSLSDGVLVKDQTLGISNELIKEEGHISIKSGNLLLLETRD